MDIMFKILESLSFVERNHPSLYVYINDISKDNDRLKEAINFARDNYHLPQDVYDKFIDALPRDINKGEK